MFSKNWQLSLLVLTVLPPMAFLINRAGKQIRKPLRLCSGKSAS
jgi:hypothetical protein